MSDQYQSGQAAYALPQPEEVSNREREDAMGAYLMTFASLGMGLPLPLLSLLISVIYHAVNAKKSRFTAFHSLQALLSEFVVALPNAVVVFWGISLLVRYEPHGDSVLADANAFWIFLVVTIILTIIYIIVSLVAAARAQKGRFIYLPVVGAFCYNHYFVQGKGKLQQEDGRNLPPKGF